MTTERIADIVQQCYDIAVRTGRPTREVAATLLADEDSRLVAEVAVEFIVSTVARAQRAKTLDAERAAQRFARPSAPRESMSRIPRKGTKARLWWEANTADGQAWAEQEAEADARSTQMFRGVVMHALDRYTEDLRVAWTAELLDSTFTLTDGSLVAWGDATIDQHAQRRHMFLTNAHAHMEGAARHELALQALRESGAETLRQMVSKPRVSVDTHA